MEFLYIFYVYYTIALSYAFSATLEKPSTLHRIKRNELDGTANASMIAKDFFKLHPDADDINNNMKKLYNDLSSTSSQIKKEAPITAMNITNQHMKNVMPRHQSSATHTKAIKTTIQSPSELKKSKKDQSSIRVDIPLVQESQMSRLFDDNGEHEKGANINHLLDSRDRYNVAINQQNPPFSIEINHLRTVPAEYNKQHRIRTSNPNYSNGNNNHNHNNNDIDIADNNNNNNTENAYNKWFSNDNQANQQQQPEHHQQQLQTVDDRQVPIEKSDLWNPIVSTTLSNVVPVENLLKIANMLLYKVGINGPKFRATGTELVVKPNYDMTGGANINPSRIVSISSAPNVNGNANTATASELDDSAGIDYLCNAMENMPAIHNVPHSVIIQPAFSMTNDATPSFNLLDSVLNMLMNGYEADPTNGIESNNVDDGIELRCPVHRERASDSATEEYKRGEKNKNGFIQVCSCRLIKNQDKQNKFTNK